MDEVVGKHKEDGSASELQLISSVRDEFDQEWKLGLSPNIAIFLTKANSEESRILLARELLRIELSYLKSNGVKPAPDEYLKILPEYPSIIAEVFKENLAFGINGEIETTILAESPNTPEPSQLHSPFPNGRIPKEVGNYEILSVIARGGMGVVYRARQRGVNRIVALKMILNGQFATKEDERRFLREAEAAGRLDHKNIVPIYEVGVFQDNPFFSMGYIDGQTLGALIAQGSLTLTQTAKLVVKVADALHFAHQHGVIHRDLKPANILIDKEGEPRITDFGLAKQSHLEQSFTSTGQILGTPSYMPPEQARGNLTLIGPAADVYSLGATLYCMLTGKPPFQSSDPLDTLKQVVEADPISPCKLKHDIPRDLETICLKCLRKSPGDRYATSAELKYDLECFLENKPIQARPISSLERIGKWCRRHPWPAASLLAMFVVLVGTIGYLFTRPAYVNLSVIPVQSHVMIDRREYLPDGNGMLTLELPPGKVLFEVFAEGYRSEQRELNAIRGVENAIMVSFNLEPTSGYLAFDSDPSLALVKVTNSEGIVVAGGATPFNSPSLPSGSYNLEVSKSLYHSIQQKVEVPFGNRLLELPLIKLEPAYEFSGSYQKLTSEIDVLQKPISNSWGFVQTPVSVILKEIGASEDISFDVNVRALLDEGISLDDSVPIVFERGTLEQGLNKLKQKIGLEWYPTQLDPLVIKITSKGVAEKTLETVIFPVGELLGDYNVVRDYSSLQVRIRDVTTAQWVEYGGRGQILPMPAANAIMVHQNWQTLRNITSLLDDMRSAVAK